MSELRYTPAQREAIEARGCPVLVSAAAGSGKTRVLTERLIARVLEWEDITRFLVITFTRAAAAELRSRILTELNERAARDPGDRRLRRQSALLYRAQIGTIDSFCASVVRENAHLLEGITPGFSVLDEERARELKARALEEVLDRAYEHIEEDPGLRVLADTVGAGRDDEGLARIVLSVYDRLQSQAFPEAWAAEALEALAAKGIDDAGDTVWGAYLLADAREEAEYRARTLEEALGLMALPGNEQIMESYGPGYTDAAALLRGFARAAGEGWDRAREALAEPWPKLKALRNFPDTALKDRVKAAWDDSRAAAKKLEETLYGDSETLLAGLRGSAPALGALTELVSALGREYGERKRRADALDFSDVEHFCVRLLCDAETGGPSALAAELSARFREVMVDEYQDVNAVQELIFQRVSGEGERLFMVGDVKQSIYRFRLAEPEIFNGKFEAFRRDEHARRVLLRENFRSRDAVLDACNAVFGRIMSPALGEIDYNDEARLVRSGSFSPQGEVLPELVLIDPASSDEEETPDKTLTEARYVARRIRAMVEAGEPVSDGAGGVRPVGYGDIAVLLRAPGSSGAAFRRALVEAGVPVSARQGGAFFSQPEVVFALSMLAVADNPRQDVPLIAAMRGLPFGFTPDELTAVRAAAKGDLWDGLAVRAEEDEKCARFIAVVTELRELSREESTEALLRWLYDRTGLLAACAVMPDGLQRGANLMLLYDYARKFEAEGNRGLFRFTAWLRRLEERGAEPAAAPPGGCVQILSIHRSKGLEYPVVFLADNSHRWVRSGDAVLCHTRLGLGMRITDGERGIDYPTLPWRAIARRTELEELSEQERVLYVAMTRAKDRLIMTCVQGKAAEKVAALGGPSDGPLEPRALMRVQNPGGWLMRAAAADGGRTILLTLAAPEGAEAVFTPEAAAPVPGDPEAVRVLGERLAWRYPWQGAVALPSKLTATGIARLGEAADPEALPLGPEVPAAETPGRSRFREPDLGRSAETPLTGAERGVAQHLVMQYIDLKKTGDEEQIAGEIERLRRAGFLDDRQAAAVPPGDILAFFRSAIGRRLLEADRVHREFRFSLLCPAETWFPGAPAGEEILLQGVVDCCIEEAGRLTVIDFKTDARAEPALYADQLRAYALAMERILKKPVAGAVLWYLRLKRAAEVPLDGAGK